MRKILRKFETADTEERWVLFPCLPLFGGSMRINSSTSVLFETSFTCWSTFVKSYFRSGICLGGLRQSILQHEVQLHLRMANTAKEQVMSSTVSAISELFSSSDCTYRLCWKPFALPENRLILIDDVISIFYLNFREIIKLETNVYGKR